MTLTERQAAALRMRRAGMRLKDIGEELGLTPSGVMKLVTRARKSEKRLIFDGLPPLTVRALFASGINSKEALLELIEAGRVMSIHRIGPYGYDAIMRWKERQL